MADTQSDPQADSRPGLRTGARIEIAGTVLAATIIAAGIGWTLSQPPLTGHQQADAVTTSIAGGLYLVAAISATATVGALLRSTFLARKELKSGSSRPLVHPPRAAWLSANRAALVWFASACVAVPFNAAAASGFPVHYVLGDPWSFMTSVQTVQSWFVAALGAGIVSAMTLIRRRWSTAVTATVLAVLMAVPTVVTAQVSVGTNHDLATDAATVFTLAVTIWFGAVWPVTSSGLEIDPAIRSRLLIICRVAFAIALPFRLGVAAFELDGQSPLRSGYGLGLILLFLLLVLLAFATLRRGAWSDRRRPMARGILIVVLGVQASLVQMVPPQFLAPQTDTQNYLGYNLPLPPNLATMALPGRPNLLLTLVALTAISLYWVAVIRLRRRGDRWPAYRPAAWTAGWIVVLLVSATHLWMYSAASFAWHMTAHMTLNMLAPPLIVLGGPLTLALRALRARSGVLPGIREAVVAVMAAPWVARLLNPLVIWVIFVGSFYLLYFSPIFGLAMRYHWAHQLMTFHFLIIGCEFYGIAIGVDRPPRDVPAVARLAVVFAAMPFHAFFAIAVLAGGGVIGANFYHSLSIGWLTDLAREQQVGGQIAWATGELPLLVVIIALVAQWFTQEQRLARRQDRAADRNGDAELGAYNDLLTELGRRGESRRSPTP